jgi:molybdate transport system regulatory protein
MKIKVKLSIVNEKGESFMGIGLVWLFRGIKSLGSIKKAAEEMRMSYAKAHRIIKRCEEELGKKMLIKTIGGNKRGGAQLTDFAEDFINRYDLYQENVKEFAQRAFEKFKADVNVYSNNKPGQLN